MSVSINWATKVITIPQADLTLISGSLYELDVDAFRLELKSIEDSEEGMAFPQTHNHNTQVTLSGVTYARTFEIINGYTITFEDVGSPYTVRCVGANHNIADVKNVNQVSLIIGNSAGLIVVDSGSGGWSTGEKNQVLSDVTRVKKLLANKQVTDPATSKMVVYDDDNTTVLVQADVFNDAAGTKPYDGTAGIERRDRLT